MNKRTSAFLSYSNKDREFVERLTKDLNSEGISIWVDIQQINPGEMWKDILTDALKKSNIIIAVLSKHSISSNWVISEIVASANLGKTIIPIKIDDFDISLLPQSIASIQWLDFTGKYKDAFQKLLTYIPEEIRQKTPIIPEKSKSKGYVFISYAEGDNSFVDSLKEYLKIKKFAYWDYQDGDRNYHSQFFLELESVIEEAVATLSIISPLWKQSVWSLREYLFSEEIGTPVFLLRIQPMKPTLAISGQPYIDFVEDKNKGFIKLTNELKRKGL